MKPRFAVPIGPYLDKSALLKMGYQDASALRRHDDHLL